MCYSSILPNANETGPRAAPGGRATAWCVQPQINTNAIVEWREDPGGWRHVNWVWLALQVGSAFVTLGVFASIILGARSDAEYDSWNNASEYYGYSFYLWMTGSILVAIGATITIHLVQRASKVRWH